MKTITLSRRMPHLFLAACGPGGRQINPTEEKVHLLTNTESATCTALSKASLFLQHFPPTPTPVPTTIWPYARRSATKPALKQLLTKAQWSLTKSHTREEAHWLDGAGKRKLLLKQSCVLCVALVPVPVNYCNDVVGGCWGWDVCLSDKREGRLTRRMCRL